MFGECHAHVIMDGKNYKKAVQMHYDGVKDEVIHSFFQAYQEKNIGFVRDGGDAGSVSRRAKELAGQYGIDYRSPIFAIHKEGEYGSIVGRSFRNMKEYYERVKEAIAEGADFIKIMTTGLMDFENNGNITGTPLEFQEVKEMVHIAHEEGMAVMSHTNGEYGFRIALEAGVDSIEHGNFLNENVMTELADSSSLWVPTLVTVRNLVGSGRYSDAVLLPIMECAAENVRTAFQKGAQLALGSDAGAYMVPHGSGTVDELNAFKEILGDTPEVEQWLQAGEDRIKEKFRRQ